MFLTDVFIIEQLKVLNEGKEGTGPMRVQGIFQCADKANNNGRIYPKVILEGQVKKLQDKINERTLCGELDHPQNDSVKLSNASHLITKLYMQGPEVIGEAEILNTPAGMTAKALIEGGVKIGISSRGTGTISENATGAKIVNEDFNMVTFDLVADPSTENAYPGMCESTESALITSTMDKFGKEKNFLTMLEAKLSESAIDRLGDSDGRKRNLLKGVVQGVAKGAAGVVGAGVKGLYHKNKYSKKNGGDGLDAKGRTASQAAASAGMQIAGSPDMVGRAVDRVNKDANAESAYQKRKSAEDKQASDAKDAEAAAEVSSGVKKAADALKLKIKNNADKHSQYKGRVAASEREQRKAEKTASQGVRTRKNVLKKNPLKEKPSSEEGYKKDFFIKAQAGSDKGPTSGSRLNLKNPSTDRKSLQKDPKDMTRPEKDAKKASNQERQTSHNQRTKTIATTLSNMANSKAPLTGTDFSKFRLPPKKK